MKTGNRYPKWKIIMSSPISIFIFLILIYMLGRAVLNIGDKMKIIDQKLDNANSEYSKLVDRESSLKERVDFLETDIGIESELRSKYKAISLGEKVAVILDNKTSTSSTAGTSTKSIGFWKKIFRYLSEL